MIKYQYVKIQIFIYRHMHCSSTLIECNTEISNKMRNKIFRICFNLLRDDIFAVGFLKIIEKSV